MFSPAFKPDWPAAAELGRQLRFVDPVALMHLSRGLTFNPLRSAEVLDDVLVHFNETSGYVAEVETWVRAGGLQAGACPAYPGGRIIADVREAANAEGKTAHTAAILKEAREAGVAPAVFLSMVSPLLDVAMRVELPMRAILHGNPALACTYTLYLHTLLTSEGEAYLYYGITKRGWNIRFHEHTRAAVATASKRLFARTLNALIDARIAERTGRADDRPKLAGLITTICATGSLAGKRMTRRRLWSRNIASRPNIPSVST
ncbi:hypothetical protein HJG53_16200 [Sphingomonas sp. ID1715]|jgi:hypothetical protein|uniref:hypothetical protein n=1 Tax=Sphingomonadales TaxID=204457 RepID=UPI000373A605|nr:MULTISPECIES: hypothetical protein [Sphingomonadaceae]ETI65515.1 hypothetical protein C100_01530 [Sphingobium sp. C100]NNM78433.1 hypothetical protein [Sphingomonas sp. ID1715]HUD95224.1 hypothetical protein [Sphingobium sp.]|tara:strand:- start:1722 stop:2504 length:783 start_codon:yes stop_codon:yes gene_type:complete